MNKLLRLLALGELTGFVSGGLIVALLPWAGVLVEQPVWLLVAIVCLSAATGFVVAAVASTQRFSSSVAVRRGVTGAAVSSIVAASLFALMARLLPGLLTLFRALLAGWLSVMPAMLAGMIAACFGVVLGRRASDVPAESGSTQPLQWGLRSVVGLVAVMGALAPVRLSVPKPPAPVVVVPQRSKPEPPLGPMSLHLDSTQLMRYSGGSRISAVCPMCFHRRSCFPRTIDGSAAFRRGITRWS